MVETSCKLFKYKSVNKEDLKAHMESFHKKLTKNNKNRRTRKRNSIMNSKFKIVGTNAAGLTSKLHSFDKLLNDLKPSVFCLQETKMKTQFRIKTENSRNYTIYELLRKSSRGGGLAIGVHNDLNSAWVSEGCLTISS